MSDATTSAPGPTDPAGAPRAPLLRVRDLRVTFETEDGPAEAVRGVDLEVAPGEILGLVGESGSGKSVTCQALMGLLPGTARATGALSVDGRAIDPMDGPALARLRGRTTSMIFQDPMSALDPLMTVRGHLMQRLKRHGVAGDRGARALDLLRRAGVPDPERVAGSYAHQLSGGLCQRAAIALALAGAPKLLVADEPTTALDVTVQAQVLDLLAELRAREGLAVILISHDLGVVARTADRVAVMYAGRLMETGPVADVLTAPAHPYAAGLLGARPDLDAPAALPRPIPGAAPRPGEAPPGCAFAPRCPRAAPACAAPPPMAVVGPGRTARCVDPGFRPAPSPAAAAAPAEAAGPVPAPGRAPAGSGLAPRLELRGVRVSFLGRHGPLRAVNGVDLAVRPGETLGIVGESGCGKSTLAKFAMRLIPGEGEVRLDGARIDGLAPRRLKPLRRRMQYVFQDPLGALDPRMSALAQVREPLDIHALGQRSVRRDVAAEALAAVGIAPHLFARAPSELSGGQRQRVVLARALVLEPDLLIADEPVSALDVSIQAEVLALLAERRRALGLTMVFISHDLAVVRQVAERVAILYLGRVVETGPAAAVFADPAHPYAAALLDAAPRLARRDRRLRLAGETPSPGARPPGCAFASRCPAASGRCRVEDPALAVEGERAVACHHPRAHRRSTEAAA